MKVLVACEYSGRVRDAFIRYGHEAISCDFLDTETPGPHIKGDVLPLLRRSWDLVIAHPPCTRLCNSGVRWLHERNLWCELDEACEFYVACWNANAEKVAVENPVMHGYARERIGLGPAHFTRQPWQFGDNFKKRTGFHVRGLDPLKPTSDLDGKTAIAEVHNAGPGANRWKDRSRTYPGIAEAMATQWGAQ